MKLKSSFFFTVREDSKEEESVSGNLLVRSGMIKKIGTGVYSYLPMGYRVLQKIEKIVREEMNQTGAQELVMPSLLPEDVYVASGRRDIFGSSMFSLKDRMERNYVLGPTHEELFVAVAKEKIKSYKDMPFNLYQMANKYRDEPRPRYGLIRVREFIMKDAYSFDADLDGMDLSYQKMYQAYQAIFDRLGLDYKIVKADTGAMGGLLSEEFQAVTDIGEDTLVLCEKCDYASNIEVSACVAREFAHEELLPIQKVHTPNHGTIEEITNYLNVSEVKVVKTLIYQVDGEFYACMIAGDCDLNELKLKKLLNAKEVVLAEPNDVERITNAKVGFAGPIGLDIPIVVDDEVLHMYNYVVGANETDYHYQNVNTKDFTYEIHGDIKNVKEHSACPNCGAPLIFKKGIEVGNTFKLGTKYSESLGLLYSDMENHLKPVQMGCYGIGIGRILAAIVEQNHDDHGICFPTSIAPYQVAIVDISGDGYASELHDTLEDKGIDVLLDDRDVRPGVKFNDMDLIGIPIRVTVGKKLAEGLVEVKLRNEQTSKDVKIEEVVSYIEKQLG